MVVLDQCGGYGVFGVVVFYEVDLCYLGVGVDFEVVFGILGGYVEGGYGVLQFDFFYVFESWQVDEVDGVVVVVDYEVFEWGELDVQDVYFDEWLWVFCLV